MVNGIDQIFGGEDRLFMGVLGLLLFLQFVFFVIKYFIIQMVVLFSNEDLHEAMIEGLVRSPSSYFDVTPTGRLTNKFSNDLGILDSTLGFTVIDAVEGPIIALVMMINIFIIDIYFLIPGILNIFFLIFYFIYCNQSIIHAK